MASSENIMNSIEHISTRIEQHKNKLRLLERHEIKNYIQSIELKRFESLSEQYLAEQCRDYLLTILKSYNEFELNFSGRSLSGYAASIFKRKTKPRLSGKSISRSLSSLHNTSSVILNLLTNDNFLTPESKENSGQPLRSVSKKRMSVSNENKVPLKKKRYSHATFNKENMMQRKLSSVESSDKSIQCKLENYEGSSLIIPRSTNRQNTMTHELRHKKSENTQISNENNCVDNTKIFDKQTYENNIPEISPEILLLQDQSQEYDNGVYSLDLYSHNENNNSKLISCTQQIIDDSFVIPEETAHSTNVCENSMVTGASPLFLDSCNETMDYAIQDMPIIFADNNNEIPDILMSQNLQPQAEPPSENSDSVPKEQPISATRTSIEDPKLQWNFYEVKGDMSKENLNMMLKECVANIKQCHTHLEEQFQIAAVEIGNQEGVSGATTALKKMFSQISSRNDRLDVDAKVELLTKLFENHTLSPRDTMTE